jgi:hypothetical protein
MQLASKRPMTVADARAELAVREPGETGAAVFGDHWAAMNMPRFATFDPQRRELLEQLLIGLWRW